MTEMGTQMAELNYMQRQRLNGYRAGLQRRNSLIQDAKFERQVHEEEKRELTAQHRQRLEEEASAAAEKRILASLNDEGVQVIWEAGEGGGGPVAFAAVFSAQGGPAFVSLILAALHKATIGVAHIETRGDVQNEGEWEVLVKCRSGKAAFLEAAKDLATSPQLRRIQLHKDAPKDSQTPWFPTHISDLDFCSHIVTKYNPEFDPRHPAYGDKAYIARRMQIVSKAAEYRHGEPIPRVEYTPEENGTWKFVFEQLHSIYPKTACKEFQKNLALFEAEAGYTADAIPQLEDVNRVLRRKTGFQMRPCGGLLSARDFLSSLAYRVFQYVRHHSAPQHCPEPDVIHELLGHAPMFSDPIVAQFSQELGLASLGASDEDIEKLATVYWFMVEFGLCKEGGELRAVGAGLLSAFGELHHALSDAPAHDPFDPWRTAVTPYQDDDYQPLYFVAESLEDAMTKLRAYAKSIKRPFSLVYDPYTETTSRVDEAGDLRPAISRLHADVLALNQAIQAIN